MKDIADSVRGNLIPQLYVLRRVPMRYRRMLPLTFMQQFQCRVVGSAQGVMKRRFQVSSIMMLLTYQKTQRN